MKRVIPFAALLGIAAGAFASFPPTKPALPAQHVPARWERSAPFFGFGGSRRSPRRGHVSRRPESMAQQQRRSFKRRNQLKHKARARHSRRM